MSVDPLRCTEGVQRLSLTGMPFLRWWCRLFINIVRDDRLEVHISSQKFSLKVPRGPDGESKIASCQPEQYMWAQSKSTATRFRRGLGSGSGSRLCTTGCVCWFARALHHIFIRHLCSFQYTLPVLSPCLQSTKQQALRDRPITLQPYFKLPCTSTRPSRENL